MKLETWVLVGMAVCLAGCNTMKEGSYSVQAIYPVNGKPLTPRGPTGDPVDCPSGGPSDACSIAIKVTDPNCAPATVSLIDYVKLGPIDVKKRVVWKLPVGFLFCQRAGDGVFLKDPNAPDDLFDPVNDPKCSDTFEWKRKKVDSNYYEYYLRFRSAGAICQKDPWMWN